MYMVISQWKPKPGREAEFKAIGMKMRSLMRGTPGVVFIEGFEAPDCNYAVHAYDDEAAYKRIVEDPQGPFAQAAAQNKIDEIADWIGSVKGATLEG